MTEIEQLAAITDDIEALGKQIEVKRKAALDIAKGMIATDHHDGSFVVRQTRVFPGSWRLFLEGPRLKADGTPHARHGGSSPVALLTNLRPRD